MTTIGSTIRMNKNYISLTEKYSDIYTRCINNKKVLIEILVSKSIRNILDNEISLDALLCD